MDTENRREATGEARSERAVEQGIGVIEQIDQVGLRPAEIAGEVTNLKKIDPIRRQILVDGDARRAKPLADGSRLAHGADAHLEATRRQAQTEFFDDALGAADDQTVHEELDP
jgi:hypothetical protein